MRGSADISLALLLGLTVVCLIPLSAQTSGVISGAVVTDDAQPQPVRRAVVTLTGSALTRDRGAITDDSGRFSFTKLPAGRFTLTVAKPSFITGA